MGVWIFGSTSLDELARLIDLPTPSEQGKFKNAQPHTPSRQAEHLTILSISPLLEKNTSNDDVSRDGIKACVSRYSVQRPWTVNGLCLSCAAGYHGIQRVSRCDQQWKRSRTRSRSASKSSSFFSRTKKKKEKNANLEFSGKFRQLYISCCWCCWCY